MNIAIDKLFKFLLCLSILYIFSGCSSKIRLSHKDLTGHLYGEPYRATAMLKLSTTFCDYKHHMILLSDTLCLNTKGTFQKAFTKVIDTRDNNPAEILEEVDIIIEPQIIWFGTSLIVEWKMTDPKGNIIWVDTIQGESVSHNKRQFKHYKDIARDISYEKIEDMNTKTFESMMQSPEIQNYVFSLNK